MARDGSGIGVEEPAMARSEREELCAEMQRRETHRVVPDESIAGPVETESSCQMACRRIVNCFRLQ